jgi:hypothetical protein
MLRPYNYASKISRLGKFLTSSEAGLKTRQPFFATFVLSVAKSLVIFWLRPCHARFFVVEYSALTRAVNTGLDFMSSRQPMEAATGCEMDGLHYSSLFVERSIS